MAGHALAPVEALDGAGGQSHVELSPDEGVGHRVVVPVDRDVVVDVHAHGLPLGEHVRAGGQRPQRRPVELFELRSTRPRKLAERPLVEPFKELRNRGVQLGQREERAMAKCGENPPLDHLNSHFRLGPIPWAAHPRGQYRHAVVADEVVVGRIQVRLVAMGAADRGAQIVGDHQLRHTAEELEGAHVRRRPVGQRLRPRRLGEGVARRPEHGHEDLCLSQLTGLAVHHRDCLPGVVHEQLLARAVLLAHHHVELRRPGPVLLAEPTVAQPLRVGRFVPPATAARASPPCAAALGEPRSSPVAGGGVPLGGGGGNSRRSSPASSTDSGTGQLSPATSARRT